MCTRPIVAVPRVLAVSCLIVLFASVELKAEDSILFNGTTSKLQNNGANVLAGSGDITMCLWVNAAGVGGGGSGGTLLLFDETGSALQLVHTNSANTLSWVAGFVGGNGKWNFSATDGAWHAVAITHAKSNPASTPQAYVDFTEVGLTTITTPLPDATPLSPDMGYGVGNGWDGRIAHVQVFNRILSAGETTSALITPGSVTNGLRLWLPMQNATDLNDRSGNGFNGTATNLVTGDAGPPIANHANVTPGVGVLPAGKTTVTKYVIPRYADGVDHPAGQLRGVGTASVIRGSFLTQSEDIFPIDTRAVVITEAYGHPNNIDFWQSGASGFPRIASISTVSNSPMGPVTVTTSAPHGLTDGQLVTISGVAGAGMANVNNATHSVNETGASTFTIPVTTTTTGSGGTFSFDQPNAVLRAVLRDLTIAGYADTTGQQPWNEATTDAYTGIGIINSEPNRYHKITSPIGVGGGSISTASDTGAVITVNTTAPHGLITGWTVQIANVINNPQANATFVVTVPMGDPDTFTIPVAGGTDMGTGGTWTLVGATDTNPIVITSYEHTLFTGASVTIQGSSNANANGAFTATYILKLKS